MLNNLKDAAAKINLENDAVAKAKMICNLIEEKGIRIVDVARLTKMTSSYICNLLRLLRLPEIVLDGYDSGNLSLSHLMIISRLKKNSDMVAAYEKILVKSLTTAQILEYVREKLYEIKTEGRKIDKETKKAIEEKYKKLDQDLKVNIIQTRMQTTVVLKLKGSFKKTSEFLKKLVS